MDAKEIRAINLPAANDQQGKLLQVLCLFVAEATAQLAELNQKIDKMMGNGCLDVTVLK